MQDKTHQLVGVYGLIFNMNNDLLIVQRAPHDSYPGMWEMPGGALEYGEDPKEGTKREVLEETGLDVTVLYPVGVTSGFSSKKNHIVRIAHLCKLNNPEQIVQLSSEHSDYQWIPFNVELEKSDLMISNFLKQILVEIKKHPHLLES